MTIQHPDFAREEEHLAVTLREMDSIAAALEEDIRQRTQRIRVSLEHKDQVSTYVHSLIKDDNAGKIYHMECAKSSPYFGRVDFKDDTASHYETFYIGRVKINRLEINSPEDILVFDWRDPVATIFYECYNGRASYNVLGRYQYQGDVRLKRQYKIVDSQLLKIADDYLAEELAPGQTQQLIADPFLTERLLQGTGRKLKDIVTSIRAEQNKIIRETLNQVMIIQGVAGSGKSTIGLHRLSYLLYNEKLDPKRMLIIAPNKIFLDYICELLPSLDADMVEQRTFYDVAVQITQKKWDIAEDEKQQVFLDPKSSPQRRQLLSTAARLKGSAEFTLVLDAWRLKKIEKFCQKLKEISLFHGQLIISRQEQMEKFMEGGGLSIAYNERVKSLRGYIRFRVQNFLDVMEARQKKKVGHTDKVFSACSEEGQKFLSRCGTGWLVDDMAAAYGEVFKDKTLFRPLKDKKYDIAAIGEHSLGVLAAGVIEKEDLAPLCYLKYLLDGLGGLNRYEHIVVDEAQDLNAFEFMLLKLLSRNSSFTIMGDIGQGIASYRSIDSWQVLLREVFATEKTVYREVNYSYRSAREIVECFNSVLPPGHTPAVPVYEIGQKPVFQAAGTVSEAARYVCQAIDDLRQKECRSIGIITKRRQDSQFVYHALRAAGYSKDLHLITGEDETYPGGVSVMAVTVAKGLEFDGVIFWNASAAEFSDQGLDARLLYVALSRALYYLYIIYRGKLTPLLARAKG